MKYFDKWLKFYNVTECHPLSDVSSFVPKCGPSYGKRCNALLNPQDLFCNTDNGFCGNTLAYKDAQPDDDSYDWDPNSCRRKNIY